MDIDAIQKKSSWEYTQHVWPMLKENQWITIDEYIKPKN